MDLVYVVLTLLITVIGGLTTAYVVHLFRVDQLYLHVKRFRSKRFSDKGHVFELRVFNQSKVIQEKVEVDMLFDLKYQLIAADRDDIKLESNKLTYAQIFPMNRVSVILMTEGPVESKSLKPSISSNTGQGQVIEYSSDIPPNRGTQFLRTAGILMALPLIIFLFVKGGDYYYKQKITDKHSLIRDISKFDPGWVGLETYLDSKLSKSYARFDLPIKFVSTSRSSEKLDIQFHITNNTSASMKVSAYFTTGSEIRDNLLQTRKDVANLAIDPLQTLPIIVETRLPNNFSNVLSVTFIIIFDGGKLLLNFYPALNEETNKTLLNVKK